MLVCARLSPHCFSTVDSPVLSPASVNILTPPPLLMLLSITGYKWEISNGKLNTQKPFCSGDAAKKQSDLLKHE